MYDAMEVGSGDYPEQKEWEATVSFVDQYNWIKQICKIAATAVQYLQRNKTTTLCCDLHAVWSLITT